MTRPLPFSQEYLKQRFDYDPSTGRLVWRSAKSTVRGKEAGTIAPSGYRLVSLGNRAWVAHRLIWVIVHGIGPDGEIDHVNGNRSDNRIENLRCVSRTDNGRNCAVSKRNTSGVLGVSWYARSRKWLAQIKVDRRQIFLGYFDSLSCAKAARSAADIKYGFHPNHGRMAGASRGSSEQEMR
jgi:hypothetical protein